MEGIGSCNNLGFDSCQIQENTGCVQIGSWGRVGDITGIYSVYRSRLYICFKFVTNENNSVLIYRLHIICYNKTRLTVAACLDFSGIPQ